MLSNKELKHKLYKSETSLFLWRAKISESQLLPIARAFKNPKCQITDIFLMDSFTEEEVILLVQFIKDPNCKIKSFDLGDNKISDLLKNEIDKQVIINKRELLLKQIKIVDNNIKTINFKDNELDHEELRRIVKSLDNPNCEVKSLIFKNNCITDKGAKLLATFLNSSNCKVNYVNLDFNKITDEGFAAIVSATKNKNCTLNNLDLKGNAISSVGAKALAKAMKDSNCPLLKVSLSENTIGDEGFKEIVGSSKNSNLNSIFVRKNNITNIGVQSLAWALTIPNCKIETINLSDNKIDDEGIEKLSRAIIDPDCRLTNLTLVNNKITNKGAELLISALENSNCKLVKIDLSDNEISDELIEKANSITAKNFKIRDDFWNLSKELLSDNSNKKLAQFSKSINSSQLHSVYQTYVLRKIIESAGKLTEGSDKISSYLYVINNLLSNGVKADRNVFFAVKNANNPEISFLVHNRDIEFLRPLYASDEDNFSIEASDGLESEEENLGNEKDEVRKLQEGHQKLQKENQELRDKFDTLFARTADSSSFAKKDEFDRVLEDKEKLENKLKKVELQVDSVGSEYKDSVQVSRNAKYIENDKDLEEAFRVMREVFSHSYIVSATMSKGNFEIENCTSVEILKMFSGASSVVAPLFLGAAYIGSEIDEAQQKAKSRNILNLNPDGSFSGYDKFSKMISQMLVITAQEDLKAAVNQSGVENQTRIKKIKGIFGKIKKDVNQFVEKGVAKLDSLTARGLFGEEYTPLQLAALSIANDSVEYIMKQNEKEIDLTKNHQNENYDELFNRIANKLFDKDALKLTLEEISSVGDNNNEGEEFDLKARIEARKAEDSKNPERDTAKEGSRLLARKNLIERRKEEEQQKKKLQADSKRNILGEKIPEEALQNNSKLLQSLGQELSKGNYRKEEYIYQINDQKEIDRIKKGKVDKLEEEEISKSSQSNKASVVADMRNLLKDQVDSDKNVKPSDLLRKVPESQTKYLKGSSKQGANDNKDIKKEADDKEEKKTEKEKELEARIAKLEAALIPPTKTNLTSSSKVNGKNGECCIVQ